MRPLAVRQFLCHNYGQTLWRANVGLVATLAVRVRVLVRGSCLWLFAWVAFWAANAAAFVFERGFGLACLHWLSIGPDICLLGQGC